MSGWKRSERYSRAIVSGMKMDCAYCWERGSWSAEAVVDNVGLDVSRIASRAEAEAMAVKCAVALVNARDPEAAAVARRKLEMLR